MVFLKSNTFSRISHECLNSIVSLVDQSRVEYEGTSLLPSRNLTARWNTALLTYSLVRGVMPSKYTQFVGPSLNPDLEHMR